MKARFKLIATLLAVATMGLTSCGSSDDSGDIPYVPPEDTGYAEIDVPDYIHPRVSLSTTFGQKIQAKVQSLYSQFKQMVYNIEGVTLDISDPTEAITKYGNYNDTLNVVGPEIAGGNNSSMIIAYPDSVAQLMKQYPNSVINLQDYLSHEVYGLGSDPYLGDKIKGEKDFISSYLEEGRQFSTEGTYVLPYLKSSEILLYNLDALKTIMPGYNPEIKEGQIEDYMKNISFDELMEIAAYAYQHRFELYLSDLEYPVFYDSDANMIISQLDQLGLDFATKKNGQIVLGMDYSDPNAAANAAQVEALVGKYVNWHNQHLLTTKGSQNTYASDWFKDQKVLFSIGSSGGAGYSFPDEGTFDYRVTVVPYAGEASNAKYISQGPSIAFLYNKSRTAEENMYDLIYSWKFYKWISNTDNNIITAVNFSEGYVPVKKSCYNTGAWQEFLKVDDMYAKTAMVLKTDIGDRFVTSLVFAGSGKYREEAGALVATALLGNSGKTITELMATAVQNTKTAMGQQ